jgi:class 3 adenylate cyclase
MPSIDLQYERVPADVTVYGKGFTLNSLSKDQFASFNQSILGLGDSLTEGEYIQSLAAFFDLEGFTDFCNQIDSHLVIPEFLDRYFHWLFDTLKEKFKEGEEADRVRIFGSLPFFAKFLGDGILFLWDTRFCGGFSGICNIAFKLTRLTKAYQSDFLVDIQKHVVKPPIKLRCGISRGQIISIGKGSDYVGSCINVASRLQKLGNLSFALSRRGFDMSKNNDHPLNKRLILKKVNIRGLGNDELVYILIDEFDTLPLPEKDLFLAP